jgi:hypothetical protein
MSTVREPTIHMASSGYRRSDATGTKMFDAPPHRHDVCVCVCVCVCVVFFVCGCVWVSFVWGDVGGCSMSHVFVVLLEQTPRTPVSHLRHGSGRCEREIIMWLPSSGASSGKIHEILTTERVHVSATKPHESTFSDLVVPVCLCGNMCVCVFFASFQLNFSLSSIHTHPHTRYQRRKVVCEQQYTPSTHLPKKTPMVRARAFSLCLIPACGPRPYLTMRLHFIPHHASV